MLAILILTLPTQPNAVRVRVWRALKTLGCGALRDGASEEEIRRLMEAFRDAANEYMAAKMAEAIANGLDRAAPGAGGDVAGGDGPPRGREDLDGP